MEERKIRSEIAEHGGMVASSGFAQINYGKDLRWFHPSSGILLNHKKKSPKQLLLKAFSG